MKRGVVMGNIKDWIRHTYHGEMMINYLHEIEGYILPKVVSDEKAVRRYCKKYFGNEADIDHPVKFYEKLNWYKLHGRNPLMQKCANKVTMQEYVIEKGYSEHLNEYYGVYTCAEDVSPDSLPDRFVLKASHGTHMQIIVKDKSAVNWKHARKLMKSWLNQDIYWRGREWVYKDMPRHIVAEKYLEDESGELRDYKVFCFNGLPKFVQVDIGRFINHIRNYYDIDWNLMPMTDYVGNDATLEIARPCSFERMLEIATSLAEPFQFVRVDFYEVSGKPYVGEMTFFHEGGSIVLIPDEWNTVIGDYWKLSE